MQISQDVKEVKKEAEEIQEKFSYAWELTSILKKELKTKNIIIIVLILLLVGTNIGWLIYESQWDYETNTQETTYTENSNITQTIN